MSDQISQTASVQTIADAYECIGVRDSSIPDGDVAAAFYTAYSHQRNIPNGKGNSFWPMKSLNMITNDRQSQLLAFVQAMIPHLTKENVSILVSKTTPARITESPTTIKDETASNERGSPSLKTPNIAVRVSPKPLIFSSPANSTSSKQRHAKIIDVSDSDDGIASDQPEDASNFSSDLSDGSSSYDDSNVSQTSEPAGGKFWNGESWCCKVCNEELDEEGNCYDDHTMNPCRYCGKDFEPVSCSRFCIECHGELPTPCSICNKDEASDEDEATEAMQMVWDDRDDVWRCTTCMWEVEANSENEGQCHCTVNPEEFISTAELVNPRAFVNPSTHWSRPAVMKRLVRPIELLYYHDYEPADSDSSGEESVDPEPDSEDEWAIDDSEFWDSTDAILEGSPVPATEVSEVVNATIVQESETPTTSDEPQTTNIDDTT